MTNSSVNGKELSINKSIEITTGKMHRFDLKEVDSFFLSNTIKIKAKAPSGKIFTTDMIFTAELFMSGTSRHHKLVKKPILLMRRKHSKPRI